MNIFYKDRELSAFSVFLVPKTMVTITDGIGVALRGLFYTLIGEVNPGLSDEIHNTHDVKPFTISPLRSCPQRKGSISRATPNQVYRVRFSTLEQGITKALIDAIEKRVKGNPNVEIGEKKWRIVRHGKGERRVHVSFANLIHAATNYPQITLHWVSLTTIKQDRVNLLFPLPRQTFTELVRKWRRFSPIPLSDDILDWIEDNVVVEAYKLQTRPVHLGSYQIHGFKGWCRFRLLDHEPGYTQALNSLASFAFYAGTGGKTTMGMGQTRVGIRQLNG
jgi:CRISPR-associated endoribonuclease Cas6